MSPVLLLTGPWDIRAFRMVWEAQISLSPVLESEQDSKGLADGQG